MTMKPSECFPVLPECFPVGGSSEVECFPGIPLSPKGRGFREALKLGVENQSSALACPGSSQQSAADPEFMVEYPAEWVDGEGAKVAPHNYSVPSGRPAE